MFTVGQAVICRNKYHNGEIGFIVEELGNNKYLIKSELEHFTFVSDEKDLELILTEKEKYILINNLLYCEEMITNIFHREIHYIMNNHYSTNKEILNHIEYQIKEILK